MFGSLYKLRAFLKKYKKEQFLAILFLLLSYFVTFYKPYIIGKVSDLIITGDYTLEILYKYLLLFGFLIFINYFINVGWSFNLYSNVHRISRDTRYDLMKKFLAQYPEFFEKNSTGTLMGRATNDVQVMSDVVGYGIMLVFDAVLYPIVLISVMAFISPILTLLTILVFIPAVFILYKMNKTFDERAEKLQESFDRMNDVTLENISSIRVIRSFNSESIFKEIFKSKIVDNAEKDMNKNKILQLYMPLSTIFNTIVITVALAVGVRLINDGRLTVGVLITYMMYLQNLAWPAMALSDFFTIGQEGQVSINRINEILNYDEDIKDKDNAVALNNPDHFEFRDFSFTYPMALHPALKNINLEFNKGDTIIIVGKTGSGKTTLLKQFLRIYNYENGKLLIDEIPIEDYKRESLIENIGYVPQQNYLFSKTIRENIDLHRGFSDIEINEASLSADFIKDVKTFPERFETLTGEKGVAMSGGQRQRISLSRTLIEKPEILILDDVFSAVDTKTETNIIENLEKSRKGKTNIIATHRFSVIKPTDKVVVMENGEIAAIGTHEEVYKSGGWYKEQYDRQFMEVENE